MSLRYLIILIVILIVLILDRITITIMIRIRIRISTLPRDEAAFAHGVSADTVSVFSPSLFTTFV
jgi:hypothetical protein